MTTTRYERVTLAGETADQGVMPGVALVPPVTRDLSALAASRASRRHHDALPPGGLFDECAQLQSDLFDKRPIDGKGSDRPATPAFDGLADGLISERQSEQEA